MSVQKIMCCVALVGMLVCSVGCNQNAVTPAITQYTIEVVGPNGDVVDTRTVTAAGPLEADDNWGGTISITDSSGHANDWEPCIIPIGYSYRVTESVVKSAGPVQAPLPDGSKVTQK